MAITYRPTSTLSAALNETDNEFTVASTTNIEAGDLLVFKNEVMHVRAVPVSGRVIVRRGYEGTRALAHINGDTFFIGNAAEFSAIREHTLGIFGSGAVVPNICIPGTRGFDVNGYEYVLVDLTATLVQGATVAISKDGLFTAAVLATTHSGPVGVLVEGGSSDQWVWALRKGYHPHAKLVGGSSLVTSTGVLRAATSVSTPSVGLLGLTTSQAYSTSVDICEQAYIYGMFPASAASTASTSASSETGYFCAVWLEHPYMNRVLTS